MIIKRKLTVADILFAFCDVEGNYFVVLAYRYTTILSAQLINFWAIIVVVTLSSLVLHVRYHYMQIIGILICIGGMGILLASDRIEDRDNSGRALDAVKGDLFALLAATFYGFSNVVEEYFVSKRPMYEVIGQLAFWASLINGLQAAIFDRSSFESATWNAHVAIYLTGYTLCLAGFYATAPLIYRLASAAFMNLSMLTGNFWGVMIGVFVLQLRVHWLYPLAFVLILLGQFVYYLGRSGRGEARKPWLGREQGVFAAKRTIDAHADADTDVDTNAILQNDVESL
jgi:solute carrier family 35, member F1/2